MSELPMAISPYLQLTSSWVAAGREGSSQCLGGEWDLWGTREAWSMAGFHGALADFAVFGVLLEPQLLDCRWYF